MVRMSWSARPSAFVSLSRSVKPPLMVTLPPSTLRMVWALRIPLPLVQALMSLPPPTVGVTWPVQCPSPACVRVIGVRVPAGSTSSAPPESPVTGCVSTTSILTVWPWARAVLDGVTVSLRPVSIITITRTVSLWLPELVMWSGPSTGLDREAPRDPPPDPDTSPLRVVEPKLAPILESLADKKIWAADVLSNERGTSTDPPAGTGIGVPKLLSMSVASAGREGVAAEDDFELGSDGEPDEPDVVQLARQTMINAEQVARPTTSHPTRRTLTIGTSKLGGLPGLTY